MREQTINPFVKYFCILVAVCLLIYSGYRAYTLSFTHDESLTYNHMVHNSIPNIMTNNTGYVSANNHILNTLSMKMDEQLFGNSELALRLQSLLAHLIYLIITFLLLKDIGNAALILCGYLLLNVNPYLLDFFSLARGYALAMSFMLISIYYFLAFVKDQRQKKLIACIVAACLSIMCNFALIIFFGALAFLLEISFFVLFRPIKQGLKKILISNIPLVVATTAMAFICYKPILALLKAQQLYFGGEIGFWSDTTGTLIQTFLYKQPYETRLTTCLQILVIIVIAGISILSIYKWATKKLSIADRNGILVWSVLMLIVFFSVLQHVVVGSKFLQERFALFIVPLFMLTLVYFLTGLATSINSKVVTMITALLVIALLYHAGRSLNLEASYNWRYDAATKAMVEDLTTEARAANGRKIKLGITWYYEPTINFYRSVKKLDWLQEVDRSGAIGAFDYYYVAREDPDYSKLTDKHPFKEYTVPHSVLLKN